MALQIMNMEHTFPSPSRLFSPGSPAWLWSHMSWRMAGLAQDPTL